MQLRCSLLTMFSDTSRMWYIRYRMKKNNKIDDTYTIIFDARDFERKVDALDMRCSMFITLCRIERDFCSFRLISTRLPTFHMIS